MYLSPKADKATNFLQSRSQGPLVLQRSTRCCCFPFLLLLLLLLLQSINYALLLVECIQLPLQFLLLLQQTSKVLLLLLLFLVLLLLFLR